MTNPPKCGSKRTTFRRGCKAERAWVKRQGFRINYVPFSHLCRNRARRYQHILNFQVQTSLRHLRKQFACRNGGPGTCGSGTAAENLLNESDAWIRVVIYERDVSRACRAGQLLPRIPCLVLYCLRGAEFLCRDVVRTFPFDPLFATCWWSARFYTRRCRARRIGLDGPLHDARQACICKRIRSFVHLWRTVVASRQRVNSIWIAKCLSVPTLYISI